MEPRTWHMLGNSFIPWTQPIPSQGLNFELIWMTCVKQAALLDFIVPTYSLCTPFHFFSILLLLSITPSPFYSPGDQMTLGLSSTLPLRANANLFFPSIHLYSRTSIQSFFPFQYWFLHFQRAGAPNWIHHNLLLMGLASIAPLKPSLTY